ncbi:MAG: hypothetical protein M3O65_00970 [Actinomycetota bacterium]|nr:hypothetical protein [Actinomycetota bacterium]
MLKVVWAALIILGAVGVSVAAMLHVRRRAPDGSYFNDGDRASGVFGALATGFSVLLGFIVFLAFETYDGARTGADVEALTVVQQVETAQFLPAEVAGELTGELVCYARSVINVEWPEMEDGTLGEQISPWGAEMFRTLKTVQPETASEQAAYGKWLDQTSAREQARIERVHGALGVVPAPLWFGLFLIFAVIVVYMLFFADSGEPRFVQAFLMGSVVTTIVAMLLLLRFFDHPYEPGVGGLRPVAMERAMVILDQQLVIVDQTEPPPCDARGVPR